jgi:hypothetical protein
MGCCNSAVIPAPPDQVCAAIRNFHDLSWSANVVQKVDVVGEASGVEIGAKRKLNDAFSETLVGLDDEAHQIRYSIDDGPGAVSRDNVVGYVGQVQVFPITEDNTSLVLWTSVWSGGGEGAKEFCDPIYQGLLGDLKAHFA